jgi:hypothetical protein
VKPHKAGRATPGMSCGACFEQPNPVYFGCRALKAAIIPAFEHKKLENVLKMTRDYQNEHNIRGFVLKTKQNRYISRKFPTNTTQHGRK